MRDFVQLSYFENSMRKILMSSEWPAQRCASPSRRHPCSHCLRGSEMGRGHAGARTCVPFRFGLRRMFPPKQSFVGAFRAPADSRQLAGSSAPLDREHRHSANKTDCRQLHWKTIRKRRVFCHCHILRSRRSALRQRLLRRASRRVGGIRIYSNKEAALDGARLLCLLSDRTD